MSIVDQAKDELRRADFGEEDSFDIDAAEPRAAIEFPYWPGRPATAGEAKEEGTIDTYTGADGKQHPIVEL